MTEAELQQELAELIQKCIKKEFEQKHMSKNLVDTLKVEYDGLSDSIIIDIPAPSYSMLKWQQEKVIVHTWHGSYADKLDKEGSSFMVYPNQGTRRGSYRVSPGNHKGFIERAINEAVQKLIASHDDLEVQYE